MFGVLTIIRPTVSRRGERITHGGRSCVCVAVQVGRSQERQRPRGNVAANVIEGYLVDPASSHMLVSKIKPCMSKHKLLHSEAANGSLGHL